MSDCISSDVYDVSEGILLWNPEDPGNIPMSEPLDCVPHVANGAGKSPRKLP